MKPSDIPTSRFVLPPDYSKLEVVDHSLLCLAAGCRGGVYLPLQFLLEHFPSSSELCLFLMEISHLITLVVLFSCWLFLDATNNFLFSGSYMISSRNAVLSASIVYF